MRNLHFCEITDKKKHFGRKILSENLLDRAWIYFIQYHDIISRAHIYVIYHHDITSICAFGEHLWILSIILRKKVYLMVDMVVTGLDIFLTR